MARLNYLDNLKVALTFLVIFHHAGQAYGDGGEWGYTPSNPEEVMPWIWHFFSTNAAFFMGLYFFISGYFIPGSYDRQGFQHLFDGVWMGAFGKFMFISVATTMLSYIFTWLLRLVPGVKRII